MTMIIVKDNQIYAVQLSTRSSVLPPVTENKNVPIDCNWVHIQNTGNKAVKVNGEITILPGGFRVYGSQNDINIFKQMLSFQFFGPDIAGQIYAEPRVELECFYARLEGCKPLQVVEI